MRGLDPSCRLADDEALHVCVRADGRPVRDGEPCWVESRAQVIEQGRVLRAAEEATEQ